jgi:hypothetical protein
MGHKLLGHNTSQIYLLHQCTPGGGGMGQAAVPGQVGVLAL